MFATARRRVSIVVIARKGLRDWSTEVWAGRHTDEALRLKVIDAYRER